jgi:acyl-CoA thioester hydrolase
MNDEEWLTNRAIVHRLRVRYSETDKAGIVYHANFLVWFHEARDAAFRAWAEDATRKRYRWSEQFQKIVARGRVIGSESLEEAGYRFLVVDTSCHHVSPARYGDELDITVVPRRTKVAKLMFTYRVLNAKTGRRLAEGSTASVIINPAGQMLVRMPTEFGWIFDESPADLEPATIAYAT